MTILNFAFTISLISLMTNVLVFSSCSIHRGFSVFSHLKFSSYKAADKFEVCLCVHVDHHRITESVRLKKTSEIENVLCLSTIMSTGSVAHQLVSCSILIFDEADIVKKHLYFIYSKGWQKTHHLKLAGGALLGSALTSFWGVQIIFLISARTVPDWTPRMLCLLITHTLVLSTVWFLSSSSCFNIRLKLCTCWKFHCVPDMLLQVPVIQLLRNRLLRQNYILSLTVALCMKFYFCPVLIEGV